MERGVTKVIMERWLKFDIVLYSKTLFCFTYNDTKRCATCEMRIVNRDSPRFRCEIDMPRNEKSDLSPLADGEVGVEVRNCQ